MKIIEVVAPLGHCDTIEGIAEHFEVRSFWRGVDTGDARCVIRMLVQDEKRQEVLDALQGALLKFEHIDIVVIPVDVALPRPEVDETEQQAKRKAATREELYNDVSRGAQLDGNYLLLVFLSTIVAAIGLIENNVAVIIGAMVIAPLLGPNIALALGTALGDRPLMAKSLNSMLVGLSMAVLVAFMIASIIPLQLTSQELLSRTDVKLDSIALAMASGAAAVLSLTTGLSSVLVGVMVAVALLPPAATMGLMFGAGQWRLAEGAGLLLAANIVSVNLAAKLVLLYRGIRPRTWLEKQQAKQSTILSLLFWIFSLAALVAIIYTRGVQLLGQ
jgi:uncharacterized hydrophobic protein (TIGR00341 family)